MQQSLLSTGHPVARFAMICFNVTFKIVTAMSPYLRNSVNTASNTVKERVEHEYRASVKFRNYFFDVSSYLRCCIQKQKIL